MNTAAAIKSPVVADAMTAYPCTIEPDMPLSDAVQLMVDHQCRHLPVVDSASTMVGILSETDIRTSVGEPERYLELHSHSQAQLRVRDVMSGPAFAVSFDRPLAEAARTFADTKLHALPVTDKFGALIGILSYVDALRLLAR